MKPLRPLLAAALLATGGVTAAPASAAGTCGSGAPLEIANVGTFESGDSAHWYTGRVFGVTAISVAAAGTVDVRLSVYDGGCALICDGGVVDTCVVNANDTVNVAVRPALPVPMTYVLTKVNLPNPP